MRFLSTPERQRMAREGAWVFLGQAGVALAGIAGVRIFTEYALPKDYGEASLMLIALMLGRNIFVAPFSNSQVRHYPEFAGAGLGNWYTHEIARWTWRGSLACALACAIVFFIWSYFRGGEIRWALLAALLALLALDAPKNIRVGRINAERRQAPYAMWMASEAWFVMLCSAVILYHWPIAEGFLAGQAAGTFLGLLLFALFLAPSWPPDSAQPAPGERPRMLKKTLAYGLPFIPLAVVSWLYGQADRFVLDGFKGTADVGLYTAAASVASKPMIMGSTFLVTLMRPILFSASEKNPVQANRVFRIWALLSVLVGVLVCLIFKFGGEWLATILLGARYREGASQLMFWVAIGYGLTPLTQAIENRLMSFGRTRSLILPQIVGAAGMLALTFVLVPKLGALGVAQARVAGSALQLLVTSIAWSTTSRESRVGSIPPLDEPPDP